MAGYDYGRGMSNNAVAAKESGKMTASGLAKTLKCSTGAVDALLTPVEWHHASSFYNKVSYYDEPTLIAVAREELDDLDLEEAGEARELLAQLRAWQAPLAGRVGRHENCLVEWIVWGGSKKHPTANEMKEAGCTVEYTKGQFVTITRPGGQVFKKKIGANGFSVHAADGCARLF